jgi:phage shock protein A
MGILSRIVTVVRANMNALLNRAEDPSKMIEQTLIDLETAYQKAKEHVARSVADKKRLEKLLMDHRRETKKWEERAILAIEKEDDNLAKEALVRKNEHTRLSTQFENELGAHSVNVEKLKDSLKELESKIGDIRRKKNLLVSKQRRAEAQDQIYQFHRSFGNHRAHGKQDRRDVGHGRCPPGISRGILRGFPGKALRETGNRGLGRGQ